MQTHTKIERAIITVLVDELDKAGFVPVKVWDGGEYQKATTLATVLDAVFSVDESTLHFAPRGNPKGWGALGVLCICGNGPDIISDWHCSNKAFSDAVDRAIARTETAELSFIEVE